ncbi:alpha/beta hydrolase [Streptomyces sp. NPDC001380]|uniref:alpha/beta hydrolase n=1 Tax=Streptomyces sp. NPDC001380 TaxID=3364566 RepID=UPI0036876C04
MPTTREPALTPRQGDGAVRAVALALPGGSVASTRRPLRIAAWGLRPLLERLNAVGGPAGVAAHVLRYRYRGWNGAEAHTAADTQWALEEVRRRYGDVPVALVGNSLGGRAAFWAAGHPLVVSVAGVAPWLPDGDPVDQLAGRRVLILHGDRDRSEAAPELSLAYAERARKATPDLCRLEVGGAGHLMLGRAPDVWALTADFVLGTLGVRPLAPLVTDAMAADGSLRTPLPVGFGR